MGYVMRQGSVSLPPRVPALGSPRFLLASSTPLAPLQQLEFEGEQYIAKLLVVVAAGLASEFLLRL